ncbi:BMP family protein [Streptomyces sp. XD-27]|uniref:BMP family lipoprotein n=1 Tax=Streptomyces sp. XD-27 TaxID=3062779 RepID=UPI0026F44B51|nr:BMP family ABC transporter substrate-binding protein [Streptomyces sp. XD-27]WKX70811.1 BMP family ABC transporter substrate-binding protein [Streptomyces sp. XD-27]
MRRVSTITVAGIATATLAFSLTACGSSSEEGGKDKGIGLAYDVGGRGDHSFNDSAAKGFDKAKKEFKVAGKDLTAKETDTDADRYQKLKDLAAAGYNPVIAVGFKYNAAVTKISKEDAFKDTDFAIIDSVVDAPNVTSLVFTENESSYLAGVAAALKSKTDKVGFIGGDSSAPLLKKFAGGFAQGVKDTKPKATVDVQWVAPNASGFGQPDRGKDIADGMLSNNIDVIYSAAGGSGAGAIEATGKKKGTWSIGVDSDQYLDPSLSAYKHSILTSAVKNVDVAVYDFIKSVLKDKKPLEGAQRFSLKTDGVGLSYSGGFLDDIKPKLEDAKKKIIDGKIKVVDTYKG